VNALVDFPHARQNCVVKKQKVRGGLVPQYVS
jgi:hypothetical protein